MDASQTYSRTHHPHQLHHHPLENVIATTTKYNPLQLDRIALIVTKAKSELIATYNRNNKNVSQSDFTAPTGEKLVSIQCNPLIAPIQ